MQTFAYKSKFCLTFADFCFAKVCKNIQKSAKLGFDKPKICMYKATFCKKSCVQNSVLYWQKSKNEKTVYCLKVYKLCFYNKKFGFVIEQKIII